MISFYRLIFPVILLVLISSLKAQNLVPNGSFEAYITCPDGLADQLPNGWMQARGTCDYYNACDFPGGVSVPSNVQGWQEALDGVAYAGFVCTDVPELTYREHLTIELESSLVIGATYFFSMYVNNAITLEQSPNKASNGQGAWFSTVLHSSLWDDNPQNNPSPILNNTQILNMSVINDSTNWVQVKGSFVADSAYTYLLIGGFLDSANIEVVNVSGEGPFENNGEAYYFVDEVRLSTDSLYAYEDLTTSLESNSYQEFSVYPNPFTDDFIIHSSIPFSGFQIYNSIGALVLEERELDTLKKSVSVAELPTGLYYIEILSKSQERKHVRVIKSN